MTTQTSPAPARRQSGGQLAAIVTGSIAGMLALAAIVAGGLLLWADSKTDRDGYASTKSERFSTSTRALATDDLDISDVPDWVLDQGRLRLTVSPRTDKPVFVGVARSEDVARYLQGTAHATIKDVDYDPFHATYETHPGRAKPAAPADQSIWAASTQGGGRQTLTWRAHNGRWSVVVMNADGSRNVDAGVRAGMRLGWLGTAAWSTLGGGALLAAISGGLLFAGLRRPRGQTEDRDPSGLPALV
jgi:hypothetical protein